MRRDTFKIISLIVFIFILITTAFLLQWYDIISIDKARNFIESHNTFPSIIFILVYVVGTIIFLPSTPFTILGGLLFGVALGFFYSIIAETISAILSFLIARHMGKDFVERMTKKRLKTYSKMVKENGLFTSFIVRLIPIMHYTSTNLILGLTKIKFRHYLIGTFVGMLIPTFILLNIGDSFKEPLSWRFYIYITLFLLLSIVPKIYSIYKRKHKLLRKD